MTTHDQTYTREVSERRLTWDNTPLNYRRAWQRHVCQDAIYAYGDGIQDRDDIYSPDSSLGFAVAPPLLPSHWSIEFPRPLGTAAGHVNTFHRSVLHAPIKVDSLLRFEGEVVAKFVKRGRTYRRDLVLIRDVTSGALVAEELREYMMGKAPENVTDTPVPAIEPLVPTSTGPTLSLAERRWEVGDELPGLSCRMVIQLMRSRTFGGRNPLHWDAEYARSQGFPKPIATGAMASGVLATMLVNAVGPVLLEDGAIEVKFVKPVFADDDVVCRGQVVERQDMAGAGRIRVDLKAENQSGETVVSGTAETWSR
jgi:acyl dehydratase